MVAMAAIAMALVVGSKGAVAVLEAIWPSLKTAKVDEAVELSEEIKSMKQQHKALDTPDNFVKASKMKRQIDQMEMRLKELKESLRSVSNSHNRNFVHSLLEVIIPAVLVIMFWATPMHKLPKDMLWPFAGIFSFPAHEEGAIGIIPWVFMCQRCFDVLVEIARGIAELVRR
mmetsp:Transcript_50036/g.156600  ORF Transcript_50036/g.156600 Transcript_50036/m.156600 type:complete len:172 (-) Transcript_50036:349-864(-)